MPLSCFRRPLALFLVSYILLLALLRAWGAFRMAPPRGWRKWAGLPSVRVRGTVLSGFSQKRLGERIRLRADGIDGEALPAPADMFVYLPGGAPEAALLRPGQRVALEGRLWRPRWPRNPWEFDERGFCSERGIVFLFKARRLEILKAAVGWHWLPQAWAEAAHRSIHRMLAQGLPPAQVALWEGLLLGYKGPLPAAAARDIQDAGVMHLLVPSGAKMSFVLALCAWAASGLRLGRGPRLAAAALAGGFYALMVGADAPYMRAYLGALIGLAALPSGRDPAGFQGVVLSAFSILLADPRQLFSAGFQMTYAAILGVMIALPRWKIPGRWPVPVRISARIGMMSFVVQLMLWPILAGVFGRCSLVGLAANVFLVPLSALYMAAGFAAWLVFCLGGPRLFDAAAALLALSAKFFFAVCSAFAACPGAAWDTGPLGPAGTAAFYLAAFGLLAVPQWGICWKAWVAAGVLAAGIFILRRERPQVRVLFWEKSGRGAILAFLPGGRSLLIASSLKPSAIEPALRKFGADPCGRVRVFPPPSLRLGRASLEFGKGTSVVSDGRSQFCILQPPLASPAPVSDAVSWGAPRSCGFGRAVSTRRDGAIWVRFDDTGYSVDAQRELYSLGRSLF